MVKLTTIREVMTLIRIYTIFCFLLANWIIIAGAKAFDIQNTLVVTDRQELHQAISQAKPGTKILIAPGEYQGGFYFRDLKGTQGDPIIISAVDPDNPPIIRGGGNCLHLSDSSYVEMHYIILSDASDNGINDDVANSYPSLPVSESDGIYGKDPLFHNAEEGDFRLKPDSPAQGIGAQVLEDAKNEQ